MELPPESFARSSLVALHPAGECCQSDMARATVRYTSLHVSNFKLLRDIEVPLSPFGCVVGENNSGKSSLLQALMLISTGAKLSAGHFHDPTQPIRLALTIEDISAADLDGLSPDHRPRVEEIVRDGQLVLVREYPPDGKSTLGYVAMVPREERFGDPAVSALLKGKRGAALVAAVEGAFPELAGTLEAASTTIDVARQAIRRLGDALPPEAKARADVPLPTGIDRSIDPLLPEPIYVPAVKDLSDDLKTTESAPFGKILSMLLPVIEHRLPDLPALLAGLDGQLNVDASRRGTAEDRRLDEIRAIEETLGARLGDVFGPVALHLRIPLPELRGILGSAQISLDDGVSGSPETKGDGLRRAVVFAILRSYAELRERLTPPPAPEGGGGGVVPARPLFLLFEEPELYLHPKAQEALLDALAVFSRDHHVLVSTHSPAFLSPTATQTFIRLRRVPGGPGGVAPHAEAWPVVISGIDLGAQFGIDARAQFAIVCYENNSAGFFSDTVVLVEGPSDLIALPHLARTLDPGWDTRKRPVVFVKVGGKDNFASYRRFFARFNVRVIVVADLDALVRGFDRLGAGARSAGLHASLMEKVNAAACASEPSNAELRNHTGDLRARWARVKACRAAVDGMSGLDDLDAAVEDFFAFEKRSSQLEILRAAEDPEVASRKRELLDCLRSEGIHVLAQGDIESYYPEAIAGASKPEKAINFCKAVTDRAAALACATGVTCEHAGGPAPVNELELLFGAIFAG